MLILSCYIYCSIIKLGRCYFFKVVNGVCKVRYSVIIIRFVLFIFTFCSIGNSICISVDPALETIITYFAGSISSSASTKPIVWVILWYTIEKINLELYWLRINFFLLKFSYFFNICLFSHVSFSLSWFDWVWYHTCFCRTYCIIPHCLCWTIDFFTQIIYCWQFGSQVFKLIDCHKH